MLPQSLGWTSAILYPITVLQDVTTQKTST